MIVRELMSEGVTTLGRNDELSRNNDNELQRQQRAATLSHNNIDEPQH